MILDTDVNDYDQLFEIAKDAIRCGVDIIQLRDKQGTTNSILKFSQKIIKLTQGRIPYIINDRADLVKMSGAVGVHLGQEDVSIKMARKMVGPQAIIGASCQTWARVQNAQREGADYIGFGSVFKTETKPERNPMNLKLLQKIANEVEVPVFAIGGINLENIFQVKLMGVSRVAVCRAICEAKNRREVIKSFKKALS